MLIETGIAIGIVIGVFLLCATALIGWIFEGERLAQEREENKNLQHENNELRAKLSHYVALNNIKVANDYYNDKEN